ALEGLGVGDRGRGVAAVLPPLAGQLDRGRDDRDPEEHHRRAAARPTEGLDRHGFRLQPGARAAPLHRAEVPRERVHLGVRPSARWDAAGVTCKARESKCGFVLNGTKLFVLDAHLADALVVVARTSEGPTPEDGTSLFLVPKATGGVNVKLLPTMDQTRKLCE